MSETNLLDTQNTSFMDTDVQSSAEGTPEANDKQKEVYRIFKTQDEFQNCIDKALGKRLMKARETEKELCDVKRELEGVFDKFNVKSLSDLMEFKGAENAQNTENEEFSAEALNEKLNELSQNEGGFFATEQAKNMLEDKRVYALVNSGFSLKDALDALRLPEILREQSEKERESVIREIRTRGLRPAEDALSGYGGFSATLDPKNLTPAQRADIKERVRRGERITF